jgi:hypothetical protein
MLESEPPRAPNPTQPNPTQPNPTQPNTPRFQLFYRFVESEEYAGAGKVGAS